MPDTLVAIFGAANFAGGVLPFEDSTFRSSLSIGDSLTWIGGGESTVVSITDNGNASFDEAQSNQTLTNDVTFGGVSYAAGQVVTPTYTIIFSGSDGNAYTMNSFNFSPNTEGEIPDAVFWEGAIPPPGTVLTVTAEINPTGSNSRLYSNMAVCFAAGTLIATQQGDVAVEALKVGDLITTFTGQNRPIRWIGRQTISQNMLADQPHFLPIVISQGALGGGLPKRTLIVSRQHRILVTSRIVQRMFGEASVFVAAHYLTALPGIWMAEATTEITYFHVLLDEHDVLCAEGVPAESLYLGEQALRALPQHRLEEIRLIMPGQMKNIDQMSLAFPVAEGAKQRQLIQRHIANNKSLLSPSTGKARVNTGPTIA